MPKRAFILKRFGQDWAETWLGSFMQGLQKHGWEVEAGTEFRKSDLMVLWGLRQRDMIERQKAAGGEVCLLERGYIGDRLKKWASVSFGGGLNNRGVFRGPFGREDQPDDASRWREHFAHLEQSWKIRDGYALILCQVPGDNSVVGVDLRGFYRKAKKSFEAMGIDVRLREHPVTAQRRGAAPRPIEEDFSGAQCAITWNSNSGVDAVLYGLPTVAMDEGSMAWDVTTHSLDYPPRICSRARWEHALAWKQWRKAELASGYCWDHVRGDL